LADDTTPVLGTRSVQHPAPTAVGCGPVVCHVSHRVGLPCRLRSKGRMVGSLGRCGPHDRSTGVQESFGPPATSDGPENLRAPALVIAGLVPLVLELPDLLLTLERQTP
jgi:hypothetical protein